MKRAIFKRFILILSLALILSGSIFGVTISSVIIDKAVDNLRFAVRLADNSLDYQGDLKAQIDALKSVPGNENTRFSLMNLEGIVLADSDVSDSNVMENHFDREEVQEALKKGAGYSTRKSETLEKSYLYVAQITANGQYIIRMSVPFSGLDQYLGILIPAILISIGITLAVSVILAVRFSRSVARPLNEIAEEMLKLKEENPDFKFKKYDYEEMNVIAETVMEMSKAVKASMKDIEFQKMVRQEFFSNVSHELKTPLTSVRGYVELLENDMVANETMRKDFLFRIKKETDNMTHLINDILMISRLETKEAEIVLSEVRVCPLLQEICDTLEPLAREHQVKLTINCRPMTIKANAQQLRELFSNLITNAIKYNKIDGEVNITVMSESKNMVFIVEDTGVGIPEEARQRIFERFYRVDKGRSKRVGGTGLGLSIVKHIVNYYNGTIELESKVGEGTKFTIRIPLASEG